MLVKNYIVKSYLKLAKSSFSSFAKIKYKLEAKNKKGNIYINSTRRNIFCTLMDVEKKKIETSCSLRVPPYENEFNERENIFKRGVLLGELFGEKVLKLGFRKIAIYLDHGLNKARKGVLRGLSKKRKRIKISFIQVSKLLPHNGCRPSKIRRKKVRTKVKNW